MTPDLLKEIREVKKQNREILKRLKLLNAPKTAWIPESKVREELNISKSTLRNLRKRYPNCSRSRATGRGFEYKESFIEQLRSGEL